MQLHRQFFQSSQVGQLSPLVEEGLSANGLSSDTLLRMVQQKGPQRLLTLFYSRPGLSKSHVFSSLVQHLQSLKVPAWFLTLSRPVKSLEDFVS